MQKVPVLLPAGSYDYLDVPRLTEDGKFVLWNIGTAAGVGAVIPLATRRHMGARGRARRDNGGGAAKGEGLVGL